MRNKGFIAGALSALLLVAAGCSTLEQRQQRQQETQRMVEQAISTRHLKVKVDHMQTQRYGSHRVTSDFYLALHGDTLESYLPFFGRAYSISYGTPSQGLNFTSPIYRFQQGTTRDGAVSMAMEVRSREDSFYYQLDIYPNGKAYIFVRPQERDVMHFSGELVAE